ncbi:tyrosine-protein phosphatase [Ornithinibacillus scapharcae]|uniref:tyrosine-protein phosphatase n=1 Tax=Ornithinibacillus scapharcae TaxID=1147159 RepID=UPI000225B9FA|nr:CpsB/CapC family capsule biosynthesis tyrosine phosphatase [Ornithinibacillus scapharcae]
MIDIHSHILAGIDDGALTWNDSLIMAKAAVEEGIHTIIATPHHQNGRYINERYNVERYIEEFQLALREEKIPLRVLAGQENRVQPNLLKQINIGNVGPLYETNYILLELPSREIPHYTFALLAQLQLAGYIPIIAHPERNHRIKEEPEILLELVQRGALAQITAASLIGEFGGPIQKFTNQIVEANLAHFIASDAHNMLERGFVLQKAYQFIRNNYGHDVYYMFFENAELLLEGQSVHRLKPMAVKQKRLFGWLTDRNG